MEKTGCNLTRNTSRTAQEVLDKIAHAMAQRRADETREELEQILKRIEIVSFINLSIHPFIAPWDQCP